MLSRHAARFSRAFSKTAGALAAVSPLARPSSLGVAPSSVPVVTRSARATATRARPLATFPAFKGLDAAVTTPLRPFSAEAEEKPEPFVPTEPREAVEFDVVIVGAGPAGLSAAIRLKQLSAAAGVELSVCVVEKAAQVGNHILSGNVFIPTYLNELFPNWKELGAPLETPVTSDSFYFLTKEHAVPLPIPPSLHNSGNYVISLGRLCEWLGQQAESLGVEIYTGFAAAEVLYSDDGKSVVGVATGDVGIGKDGQPTSNYARGMELRAKQTLFGEGARGSCSEELIDRFNLREGKEAQTYGIGLKEIWEIDPAKHQPGKVVHTIGHPTALDTYAGSFLYHLEGNQVLIGLVVGLDYKNPYTNPYLEFQTYKHHPMVKSVLEGGRCISYGARVINEGGFQSIPKVAFPGGALLGCSAGYVNVPKIKGSHNAMKSGMEAAEAIFERVAAHAGAAYSRADGGVEKTFPLPGGDALDLGAALAEHEVVEIGERMQTSPVTADLKDCRNVRPAWKFGLLPFLMLGGLEQFILRRAAPWTISHGHGSDAAATKKASECKPIEYMKPDGVISFPLLDNLMRSGVSHEENQPSHLKIKPGKEHMPAVSLAEFAAPESRFCPAGVYEYPERADGTRQLQINAQNCIHCKTCSIKTPEEFIKWTVPEGGGGPAYSGM